jgi:phage terminase large subunit
VGNGGEGLRAVCLREIQKDLRQSSKLLIEDKIRRRGFGPPGWKVYDKVISTPGDGIIIFQGMQNHTADSVKSLEGFKLAWCEEAQNFSERSLTLLRPTSAPPGPSWASWNPNDADDPIETLLVKAPPPGAIVVHANYMDNPWLTHELRAEMEYDRDRDPEKYAHVWLGQYRARSPRRCSRTGASASSTSRRGAAVLRRRLGLLVDPSVLIRAWFIGDRTLYIDREAYAVGCEIDNTPALFAGSDQTSRRAGRTRCEWPRASRAPLSGRSRPTARGPRRSATCRSAGFNITPALKGPSSLEDGVEFLQSRDIVVHEDCKHVISELTRYAYKVDKRTEQVLPVLDDKHNHTIDAVRYAVESVRRRESVYGSEDGIAEPAKNIPSDLDPRRRRRQ